MEKKFNLFNLAWPIFLENLFRLSLGMVNVYMINKLSRTAVGAVNVANDIISIPIVLFSIIGTGTAISINQYLGSKQTEKANKIAKVAIFVNFLFGLFLSLLLIVFTEQLLQLMKLPEDRITYGILYMRIVGGAVFIQSLTSTMSGIFRSFGYTKLPMYIALLSNAINVLGNITIIYGFPQFGVIGIAVTHVIAISSSMILMFILLKLYIKLDFSIKDFIPFPTQIIRSIVRIGIPSAGEFISYRGSQLMIAYFINIMIVSYDAINTRVYTSQIMNFVWVLGMSIGSATLIIVGHLVGAKEYDKAYKLALRNLKYAMIVNTSLAIIAALNAKILFSLFTTELDITKIGTTLLFITIILEPGRAYNLVIVNALRAAGDVRYPVVIGIISMWLLSVPLAYLLGIFFNLGLIGIWIAFTTDEWARGFILYIRWKKRKWITKSII